MDNYRIQDQILFLVKGKALDKSTVINLFLKNHKDENKNLIRSNIDRLLDNGCIAYNDVNKIGITDKGLSVIDSGGSEINFQNQQQIAIDTEEEARIRAKRDEVHLEWLQTGIISNKSKVFTNKVQLIFFIINVIFLFVNLYLFIHYKG